MSWWMHTVAFAGAAFIRALGVTWRITQDRPEIYDTARAQSGNLIFAFWHGRLLPLTWTYRNRAIHVLASEHRDGDLLARTIRFLGFGNVRGSSTRGGVRGIRNLVAAIHAGFDVGITVDGPVGPRYVVKPGPIEVAKLSGAAIVPVSTASHRHKTFASWDAFELPAAFTRVYVGFGDPVIVPADADGEAIEEYRRTLERRLCDLTDAMDAKAESRG